ncbi:MAG TPA: thiolase domain-containing protein [Anaerolineae bacterium]|nr:thiolase domain-containing protein [Anaerolineae bacterium]
MRPVSIVGIGQIPVQKQTKQSLRQMGAEVVRLAMADAEVDRVDALFAGNMLGDELQGQKHVAALIADEAGLAGVEALDVRAATGTGAAALRMAYLAVASGEADLAVAVGVEKMSDGVPTPVLAKALDAEQEVVNGDTLIGKNAEIMRLYMQQFNVPDDGFVNFALNAHANARNNPNALFRDKVVTREMVLNSRVIQYPLRLFDSSPICDGAAAVVLAPTKEARAYSPNPVKILGAGVATDRFRVFDREDPLFLKGSHLSALKAFRHANVHRRDVDFFELHDAFSIMAALILEAVGYARQGEGWRLAQEMRIGLEGDIPIATMGGLKARGHPIGATALYQVCEIVLQLTGRAGPNQLPSPEIAMMQSVGGAGTTVITHIFGL